MTTPGTKPHSSTQNGDAGPSRRAITTTGAWSVPVIALAIAAPDAASSTQQPGVHVIAGSALQGVQNAFVGATTIQVRDASGRGVAGQPVRVTVVSGHVEFWPDYTKPSARPDLNLVTDASGFAYILTEHATDHTGVVTLAIDAGRVYGTTTSTQSIYPSSLVEHFAILMYTDFQYPAGPFASAFTNVTVSTSTGSTVSKGVNLYPDNNLGFTYYSLGRPYTQKPIGEKIDFSLTGGGPLRFSNGSFVASFPVTTTSGTPGTFPAYSSVKLPAGAVVYNPDHKWFSGSISGVSTALSYLTTFLPSGEVFPVALYTAKK